MGRLVTDRWSIELPDGWTADRSGERIQLIPASSTARVVVSDLELELAQPTPEIVVSSLRSLLDGAKVTTNRVEQETTSTADGRLVAIGQGKGEQGFCSAAAQAWPGTVLLVSLFQTDDNQAVRDEANAIFASVRRVDPEQESEHPAEPEKKKSLLGRLIRR
jgi:hypothetical protein